MRCVEIGHYIKNLKLLQHVCFCCSVFLLALITLTIFPNDHTPDVEAATTQTTTLTLSTSTVSTSLFPNNATGTFIDSDPSTISVTTNNYTGYTLGIKSSNNTTNTKLINTEDSTSYLTSISSASTADEFNANNWGYLPSKLNGANNTKYQPAPTTTSTTLDTTNAANSAANTYTIKLGTKIDYTLPTGIYTNSYTVTAVANPVTYSITYNKNTTDTVSNMPSTQSGDTSSTTVTLSSKTPSRAHYDFLGWCTTTPTTSGNTDTCSGTTYQPGAKVTMNPTTANALTLKAMWFKMYTCSARYKLQNADGTYPSSYTSAGVVAEDLHNGDTCSYTSTQSTTYYTNQTGNATVSNANAVISLSIPRKTYKLTFADSTYAKVSTGTTGNYRWGQSISIKATYNKGGDFSSWSATAGTIASSTSASTTFTMPASDATVTANGAKLYLQNLASSKCTTTARYAYDNRDSDIYQIQKLADGKCWMLENLRLGGTSAITVTTSNTNSKGNFTLPASTAQSTFDPNTTSAWTTAKINTSVKNSTSTVSGTSVKYGTYYNYCAASAGTFCRSSTNSGSGTISYDICPKAWRIPTGVASTGEFAKLYAAYSNNYNSLQNVFKMPFNGCMLADNAYPRGSTGCLWTSNWENSTSRNFYITTSTIYPADASRFVYGIGIRCILK